MIIKPLVSICSLTYNHENYISQALEGFLMQKTTFPIEIIIHDDASTDNTTNIIREYENKYPDIIKPIYQNENQWSKGIRPSSTYVWPCTKGKYIALCEGDDYWTDPYKLQKQVDFMEANTEYSMCFHLVENFYQDGSKPSFIYPYKKRQQPIYSLQDVLKYFFINTCSVIYRLDNKILPEWFSKHMLGDYTLHLLYADKGKIRLIPEVMARYRIHSGGIWSSRSGKDTINKLNDLINLLNDFDKHTKNKHSNDINRRILKLKKAVVHLLLDNKKTNEAVIALSKVSSCMTSIDKIRYQLHLNFPILYTLLKRLKTLISIILCKFI